MKIAYWAMLACISILAIAEVISMTAERQKQGISPELKAKLECEKIIPFEGNEQLMKVCIEAHTEEGRHPGW